jgi:hypothetical protein
MCIFSTGSTELHERTFYLYVLKMFSFFFAGSTNYWKLIVERTVYIQRVLTLYYKLINKCNVCMCWLVIIIQMAIFIYCNLLLFAALFSVKERNKK